MALFRTQTPAIVGWMVSGLLGSFFISKPAPQLWGDLQGIGTPRKVVNVLVFSPYIAASHRQVLFGPLGPRQSLIFDQNRAFGAMEHREPPEAKSPRNGQNNDQKQAPFP